MWWQWVTFGIGVIVGVFLGMLIMGMCVAAAEEDERMAERYERYLSGR